MDFKLPDDIEKFRIKTRKFVDETNLSFTWLLTPKELEQHGLLLPAIGLSVSAINILGMFYLLRTDKSRLTKESDFYERLTPKTNTKLDSEE